MNRVRRKAQRAGFTLVEMLAVLTIIGLIMTLSITLVRPPAPRLRLEAAVRSLCAAARATRMRAIVTNEETVLTIDLGRKIFFSPAIAATALPSDARVEVSVADGAGRHGAKAGIVFFPGGGSSGGDVTLELSGNRARLEVNWLTGEARCGAA